MSGLNDHEKDDLVLEELSERGDMGAIPRPVYVWIYGTEDDLQAVADRLTAHDWKCELEQQDERWVLRAEREQSATRDAIHAMSSEILAAMAGTGADYDGWETSVERAH